MIRKIRYNSTWETEFDWLKPSKMSDYFALCTFCKQYFEIDGSGKSQVIRHLKSLRHVQIEKNRNKNKVEKVPVKVNQNSKLNKDEEVINAEIFWTLRTVECCYSFNACPSVEVFSLMFPDSGIARSMDLGRAKMKHLAQFGLATHIEKMLKLDIQGSPFAFVLDEINSSSHRKQFDVYVQYWSSLDDKFIPAKYCGTVFVGNLRADNLKTNFFEFMKKLGLDCSLLMQISITGSNTNLKLQKLLMKELDELYFTSLLDVGTCSVHPICTGLKKGLGYLKFPYEHFLNDLVFFFRNSSSRKEDDKTLDALAEAASRFLEGHGVSKWLWLKPALLKVLEQYRNVKDYFLAYLPKQENFKREIENTSKYKFIARTLKDRKTLIYIHFINNVIGTFEPLFNLFQKEEPSMHVLYDDLSSLLYELMSHFLKHNLLIKNAKKLDGARLCEIDCKNANLQLPTIGMSSSLRKDIGQSSLNAKIVSEIHNEFSQFYIESTTYLQKKLPLSSHLLKDIRHLHPLRRDLDAISRICKTVVHAVRNESVLNRLFQTQGKDKSSLCEIIINQAKMYVLEKNLHCETLEEHWHHVGQIKNSFGEKKYLQLHVLAKTIMVLSHGNATSERGFVVHRNILERNNNVIDEESVVAIKLIKDYLNRVGGIEKFNVERDLIKTVKNSHKKYVEYMDKKNRSRKG